MYAITTFPAKWLSSTINIVNATLWSSDLSLSLYFVWMFREVNSAQFMFWISFRVNFIWRVYVWMLYCCDNMLGFLYNHMHPRVTEQSARRLIQTYNCLSPDEILIQWTGGHGPLARYLNWGCACAGNVFPYTAGKRSRHAARHVRDARVVMHVGIAN